MKKILLGLILGCISGAVAVLMIKANDDPAEGNMGDAISIESAAKAVNELGALKAANVRLQSENDLLRRELETARAEAAEVARNEVSNDGKGPGAFIKMMMQLGSKKEEREVSATVDQWTDRLELTEEQSKQVEAALLARLEAKREAEQRFMNGEATIADLGASDEHNYSSIDTAMASILDGEQQAIYTEIQEERELARVETKTNEDMEGLNGITGLTEDQRDQAWDVFVQLNAADVPSDVPEGTTIDDVNAHINGQIDQRLESLSPVLEENQLVQYNERLDVYREMISGMIQTGLGFDAESGDK